KANAGSNKRSNHRASQGEFFNNIRPFHRMMLKDRRTGMQRLRAKLRARQRAISKQKYEAIKTN
ncbi:hypothetical protein, partial [uncultured Tateyamaria sp.]|uniref:hypothetical protein n=1 Tax=uncultured Tateyamaria sp. TaxID=455651 RepID=UPI00261943B6